MFGDIILKVKHTKGLIEMKTLKRIMALVLCLVMFGTLAVPAFAVDELIKKASASFTIPKAGDTVKYGEITSGNKKQYKASVDKIYYVDPSTKETVYPKEGTSYLAGAYYKVRITFAANKGYYLDDLKTVYYVNEKKNNAVVGVHTVEISFKIPDSAPVKPDPQEGENTSGNFLTAILEAISSFIARITAFLSAFGAKN